MSSKKKSAGRRRTPEPELKNPLHEFFRNISWGWLVLFAGGVGTILGAIVMYDKAHPIIEPWWYGSRGYVREFSTETTTKKVEPLAKSFEDYRGTTEAFRIEQTMEITKLNLNTLTSQLDSAKKEVELYPNSVAARESLARLTKSVADTRKRIEDYESALLKKRSER